MVQINKQIMVLLLYCITIILQSLDLNNDIIITNISIICLGLLMDSYTFCHLKSVSHDTQPYILQPLLTSSGHVKHFHTDYCNKVAFIEQIYQQNLTKPRTNGSLPPTKAWKIWVSPAFRKPDVVTMFIFACYFFS